MRQIGHGVHDRVVRQIGGRAGLDHDFVFKTTSIQINEGFGGRDQKFHRVDPSGHGSQLNEPDPQHGRIRLGDLEHLQFGAYDPRRKIVGLHRSTSFQTLGRTWASYTLT